MVVHFEREIAQIEYHNMPTHNNKKTTLTTNQKRPAGGDTREPNIPLTPDLTKTACNGHTCMDQSNCNCETLWASSC